MEPRSTRALRRLLIPAAMVITGVAFALTHEGAASAVGAGPVLPETLYDYEGQALPGHFSVDAIPGPNQSSVVAADNTPSDNPVTDAGATLGRVLFYDKSLSANGSISCASCHQQSSGFTDPERFSTGFEGGLTRRNSMPLANAAFYEEGTFFWDERAATLEDQVLMPFQNDVEMGLTLEQLVGLVEDQGYYESLFADAFGDPAVTAERISAALAQFVRSIVTLDSKYDQGRALVSDPRDPFPNFTSQENQGKALFFQGGQGVASCASCHVTEAFVSSSRGALNNGLDLFSTDDLGLAEVTGRVGDEGKFKSPSLRNIAVTAPYMHDGRFATLEAVVQHYSTGVQDHPNLSPPLVGPDGRPQLRNFTQQQSAALVAFLETLTDQSMLTDPKYGDPFTGSGSGCEEGYFVAEADGDVYGFGDGAGVVGTRAEGAGDLVDIAAVSDGDRCGYLALYEDGTVHPSAGVFDPGDLSVNGFGSGELFTSMSVTASGRGVWAFTNRGRIVTLGDAAPFGAGSSDLLHLDLAGDIVDSVVTPDGSGGYMLGEDGGVFAMGTATFVGSVPGLGLGRLDGDVVGLVPDPDGSGYWAVASDGGVFAFGARFRGSLPALGVDSLNGSVVGMVSYGDGYLQVASDGGVFNFSDRAFRGSLGEHPPDSPIVAIAPLD